MGRRRGARKLALDVLYQHELTGRPVAEIMDRYRLNPAYEFAETVVSGVTEYLDELDDLISSHAEDWSIKRMPVLDRNLLRMALFEMLHLDDVPSAVAINEAVELAKIYSTEDSSRFINGILGTVAAGS